MRSLMACGDASMDEGRQYFGIAAIVWDENGPIDTVYRSGRAEKGKDILDYEVEAAKLAAHLCRKHRAAVPIVYTDNREIQESMGDDGIILKCMQDGSTTVNVRAMHKSAHKLANDRMKLEMGRK